MDYQNPYTPIGQASYDSQGYADLMSTPTYGQNPWGGQVGQAGGYVQQAGQAAQGIPQQQMMLADQQSNMNRYAASTGNGYPTMPNTFGLGSQYSVPANQNKGNGNSDVTTRGFNPWSLQGEALSR